ncbi:hypothetical protein Tco_0300131 [Tanacetum coccineum]
MAQDANILLEGADFCEAGLVLCHPETDSAAFPSMNSGPPLGVPSKTVNCLMARHDKPFLVRLDTMKCGLNLTGFMS